MSTPNWTTPRNKSMSPVPAPLPPISATRSVRPRVFRGCGRLNRTVGTSPIVTEFGSMEVAEQAGIAYQTCIAGVPPALSHPSIVERRRDRQTRAAGQRPISKC